MLALGIPTGPITAVLIGALMIHGVPAGPQLVNEHPRRVLGLRRLDVCRQRDAAAAQPAAGRPVRQRAAHPLRLSLSADHHVLHHRRLRGEPLDRRRLDHADHGRARLRAAQVRLRPGAAGARPRDRADLRAEPAPVADHVERQLLDLLQPADRARLDAGVCILLGLSALSFVLKRKDWRDRSPRWKPAKAEDLDIALHASGVFLMSAHALRDLSAPAEAFNHGPDLSRRLPARRNERASERWKCSFSWLAFSWAASAASLPASCSRAN